MNDAHRSFLDGVMRVDIFGVKDGGTISGELIAPLRPHVPTLRPGQSYLLETVIRTVKMGHLFTQGTADSNQVWLEVEARQGGEVFARSGGQNAIGEVDPWSHFVNAYVIDRNGKRIERRNVEDVFIDLYNNQIPPGAADVVHFKLDIPRDTRGEIEVEVQLKYRKFDTTYMRFVQGESFTRNELPVTILASDRVRFPVSRSPSAEATSASPEIPEWERWNDYGIGLLRKGGRGELRQAEHAFRKVESLNSPEGPLNLARVYIREGLVQSQAPEALRRAQAFDPSPRPWTLLWLTGQVNKQNGNYEEATRNFEELIQGGFSQAQGRGFDFSKDYRLLVELGQVFHRRALRERGGERREQREQLLRDSESWFLRALELDPENLAAHWGLKQVYQSLRERDKEQTHSRLHALYKPDDNARDSAIAFARQDNPAANQAAEAVVIYDLNRPGAADFSSAESPVKALGTSESGRERR